MCESLVSQWRVVAETLRRRGATAQAVVLESCAEELEAALWEHEQATLTLKEAAEESGYSVQHLRRLVTQGLLTDVAESSQIRVRRGDLPRKPGHKDPYPLLRTA